METRHDDTDGSNIFWPGYVDATTNLVLNLLFLLTIMIVAVFMFALELGRSSSDITNKPPIAANKKDADVVSKPSPDPAKENIALKLEIQRLKMKLAKLGSQEPKSAETEKSFDATAKVPKPQKGLDGTLAGGFEIVVRFSDEAIEFTPAERKRLLNTLKPVLESEKTSIHVEVPAGFSEAKRMGFYRAMSVRNLLIEMKIPKEKINVSVVEGKIGANASLVKVRSR